MAENNVASALPYPLTKMTFVVTCTGYGTAYFTEVTGLDASVDVIEFRHGDHSSLAMRKIPGLVHHGNLTLKYGYATTDVKKWVNACTSDVRSPSSLAGGASNGQYPRINVSIELIDITQGYDTKATAASKKVWLLKNAWVTKYTAPDLNSSASEVAIETLEIAYEELGELPN